MSLSSQDIAALVTLGSPVLCVDTCTVLDVIRDITRETVILSDVSAGLALLAMAETDSGLIVLMAEQVTLELANHVAEVEKEALRGLEKFQSQVQRIHDVAVAYGAQGVLQAHHLNEYVSEVVACEGDRVFNKRRSSVSSDETRNHREVTTDHQPQDLSGVESSHGQSAGDVAGKFFWQIC